MEVIDVSKFLGEEYVVLTEPLPKEKVLENPKAKISGVVAVTLADMIDQDIDGFLDIIEGALAGEVPLMEIEYKLVGCADENTVLLLVSAYVDEYEIVA